MLKNLFDALLLKGLWKFKPIHVIALWLFMAYQGWMASPYFMYYVVGAPEPGTAQRYVGTLRIEGETTRGKSGSIPPRYFLDTEKGELEFHCDYRPIRLDCTIWIGGHTLKQPSKYVGQKLEIGYDPYWGIDHLRLPHQVSTFERRAASEEVMQIRRSSLNYHSTSLAFFIGLVLLYLYFIWQAVEARQASSSSTNSSPRSKP